MPLDIHSEVCLEPQNKRGHVVPEYGGKPLFEAGDGDFELWVNKTCFETHRYLIKRFNGLKDQMQASKGVLRLQRDKRGADDFRRTFKVLYASVLEGAIEFDRQTLVSALRIATAYNHPSLRSYAINCLEKVNLTVVERINIAREFELTSWEEPVRAELCTRDQPITMEEASTLGLEVFVHVAEMREKNKLRREEGPTRQTRMSVHPMVPSLRLGSVAFNSNSLPIAAPQASQTLRLGSLSSSFSTINTLVLSGTTTSRTSGGNKAGGFNIIGNPVDARSGTVPVFPAHIVKKECDNPMDESLATSDSQNEIQAQGYAAGYKESTFPNSSATPPASESSTDMEIVVAPESPTNKLASSPSDSKHARTSLILDRSAIQRRLDTPHTSSHKVTPMAPPDPTTRPKSQNEGPREPIVPEYNGEPLFELEDSDLELWVNGTRFQTHRYLIKRFSALRPQLRDLSSKAALKLQRDEGGVEDFRCTFKVLYASVIEGPTRFETQTLVSALRVATAYDYPSLRSYAIKCLEKARPSAAERIKIAREFELTSWEEPAYVELCKRNEPIKIEEAEALGLEAFVHVAGIRERQQLQRGEDMERQKQKPPRPVFPFSRPLLHASKGPLTPQDSKPPFGTPNTTTSPFASSGFAINSGFQTREPVNPFASQVSSDAPGTAKPRFGSNTGRTIKGDNTSMPRKDNIDNNLPGAISALSLTDLTTLVTHSNSSLTVEASKSTNSDNTSTTTTTDSGTTTWPYIATQVCEDMGTSVLYQSIAAMSKYSDFSFEELRTQDYTKFQLIPDPNDPPAPNTPTIEDQVRQMLGALKERREGA